MNYLFHKNKLENNILQELWIDFNSQDVIPSLGLDSLALVFHWVLYAATNDRYYIDYSYIYNHIISLSSKKRLRKIKAELEGYNIICKFL